MAVRDPGGEKHPYFRVLLAPGSHTAIVFMQSYFRVTRDGQSESLCGRGPYSL